MILMRKANNLYALLRMAQIKVDMKRPKSAEGNLKDIEKFNTTFERAEVCMCQGDIVMIKDKVDL